MGKIYSVTQINNFIKGLLEQDTYLENLQVSGEVSNVRYHPSGHIYFTLKDEGGSMHGIMYRSSVPSMKFRMKDGDKVVITGSINVYVKGGYYQITARKIEAEGDGELYRKFLALKEELEDMGMFAPEYKSKIPRYVKKIGIVTAPTGAAVRDMIRISKRRNPYISIVLYPALVQGQGAAESIVRGIETLDEMGLDVIIVGRGGGSIEDLWAFNERPVAEAIFNCMTPIISAVGHETDTTIADFVADLRAATPSEAAEKAVTDYIEIENRLADDTDMLVRSMNLKLERLKSRLEVAGHRLQALSPEARLNEYKLRISNLSDRLNSNIKTEISSCRAKVPGKDALYHLLWMKLESEKKRLIRNSGRLDALSPLRKLESGYCYPVNGDGKHVSSVDEISSGDRLKMYLKDGIVHGKVESVERDERWQYGCKE